MVTQDLIYAKEVFYKYEGSFYQMKRDGVYDQYKKLMVPRELELQWMKEKTDELVNALLKCKNHKKTAELFALYGHYAVQMKDEEMLDFMINYVSDQINNWDTNTITRNINVILSSINIIGTQNKKSNVINKCIMWLEDILNNDIVISDDYKEGEDIPEYLSKERELASIRGTIKYWSDISKKS